MSRALVIAASTAVLLITTVLAVAWGVAHLSLADLWRAVLLKIDGKALDEARQLAWTIVFDLRLPRVLAAAFVGASLSAAGVIAQGLFRESLASPTVLGTEAGGSLAAALCFFLGVAYAHWFTLPLVSLAGAMGASALVIAAAKRSSLRPSHGFAAPVTTLLLAGFALNALLGAATSLLVTLAFEDPRRAARALAFLIGGFAGKGWEHVGLGAGCFAFGMMAAWDLRGPLDVLSLGEATASSLAVDPQKLRRRALFAIGVLVAGGVSVAGAIPFLGLIVPHAARRQVGPAHGALLATSALQGACLMILADLGARISLAPAELPAGIVTALLGAPFFLLLLGSGRGA